MAMTPIQWGYALRRRALALLRWRTQGVKVMVFDPAGALMLIRNGYGDTGAWILPGGGVQWRETPDAAAEREVREETGCGIGGVAVATFGSRAEGKRDTVHLFRGVTRDIPVAERGAVAEARFFAIDALPDRVSPATRRRIDEMTGASTRGDRW